ncbi:putative protein furry homolog-like, partial [Triplophysa rosa]
EFLKSLVPTAISGDGGMPATDAGGVWLRDTGPRLLRIKRLGMQPVPQVNEEEQDATTPTGRPVVRLQRHRGKAPVPSSTCFFSCKADLQTIRETCPARRVT